MRGGLGRRLGVWYSGRLHYSVKRYGVAKNCIRKSLGFGGMRILLEQLLLLYNNFVCVGLYLSECWGQQIESVG